MSDYHCTIPETKTELDQTFALRWEIFQRDLRYLRDPAPAVPREVDAFDTLPTTIHFVVHARGTLAATARLLLPNAEVARANGTRLGIDLESKLELAGFDLPGAVVAETTRLCVLQSFRGSAVLACLYAAMYAESRRRGVTHWVAAANTETDALDDAHIMYRVAERRGLKSPSCRMTPLVGPERSAAPSRPFYGPEERGRAARGDLSGLPLPKTLSLYACTMGARIAGEPIYDPRFHMCSMPIVLSLDDEAWLSRDVGGAPRRSPRGERRAAPAMPQPRSEGDVSWSI